MAVGKLIYQPLSIGHSSYRGGGRRSAPPPITLLNSRYGNTDYSFFTFNLNLYLTSCFFSQKPSFTLFF